MTYTSFFFSSQLLCQGTTGMPQTYLFIFSLLYMYIFPHSMSKEKSKKKKFFFNLNSFLHVVRKHCYKTSLFLSKNTFCSYRGSDTNNQQSLFFHQPAIFLVSFIHTPPPNILCLGYSASALCPFYSVLPTIWGVFNKKWGYSSYLVILLLNQRY